MENKELFIEGIIDPNRQGEKVTIPRHKRVLSIDGIGVETDWCDSTTGIVIITGGVPYYVAVVQCINANSNKPEVKQCCLIIKD